MGQSGVYYRCSGRKQVRSLHEPVAVRCGYVVFLSGAANRRQAIGEKL